MTTLLRTRAMLNSLRANFALHHPIFAETITAPNAASVPRHVPPPVPYHFGHVSHRQPSHSKLPTDHELSLTHTIGNNENYNIDDNMHNTNNNTISNNDSNTSQSSHDAHTSYTPTPPSPDSPLHTHRLPHAATNTTRTTRTFPPRQNQHHADPTFIPMQHRCARRLEDRHECFAA